MRVRRLFGVWGLTLSCLALAAAAGGARFRSCAFEPPRPAPDFALPSRTEWGKTNLSPRWYALAFWRVVASIGASTSEGRSARLAQSHSPRRTRRLRVTALTDRPRACGRSRSSSSMALYRASLR
jgi:hypothetical protein